MIAETEKVLEPASRDAIAIGLAALIDARYPPDNERKAELMRAWWGRVEALWVASLAHVPQDLFELGISRAMAGKYLKVPADFLAHISDELQARREAVVRLRVARQCKLREVAADPMPAERDLVGVAEMMKAIRASLRDAKVRRGHED